MLKNTLCTISRKIRRCHLYAEWAYLCWKEEWKRLYSNWLHWGLQSFFRGISCETVGRLLEITATVSSYWSHNTYYYCTFRFEYLLGTVESLTITFPSPRVTSLCTIWRLSISSSLYLNLSRSSIFLHWMTRMERIGYYRREHRLSSTVDCGQRAQKGSFEPFSFSPCDGQREIISKATCTCAFQFVWRNI